MISKYDQFVNEAASKKSAVKKTIPKIAASKKASGKKLDLNIKTVKKSIPKPKTQIDIIKEFCKKHEIENYTINEDMSIDVEEDVYIGGIEKMPVRFNKVLGDFDCSNGDLITLEGFPIFVGGDFNCGSNHLKNLLECPEEVVGNFYCFHNQLNTLKGRSKKVGGHFVCSNNRLISLYGCPESIEGDFDCSNNLLETLEGCAKTIKGEFLCSNNKLRNFIGFPETYDSEFIDFSGNPCHSIIKFFNYNVKAIHLINEFDVISKGGHSISVDRLSEVFNQMIFINHQKNDSHFKNYKLI